MFRNSHLLERCFCTHSSSCFHEDATPISASLQEQRVRFLENLLCFKRAHQGTGETHRGVEHCSRPRTSGVDTFNTGILNARPAGVGRNTLTTAGYANLDLRWSHDFALTKARDKTPALTFAVDAFNVLNHTNYSNYVGNVQSQSFGQPTSALAARRIQFT